MSPIQLAAQALLLLTASTIADKRHASFEPSEYFQFFENPASYASSGAYSSSFGGSGSFGSSGCPPSVPCNNQFEFPTGYQFAEEVFKHIPQQAFWWQTDDSPFKQVHEFYKKCAKGQCTEIPGASGLDKFHGKLPENGCNSNGCSFSGTFDTTGKQTPKPGMMDLSKNPFLNGQFNSVKISSCTGVSCPGGKPQTTITTCKGGDCKTVQGPGELNLQNNPFFKEGFAIAGTFGGGSQGIPSKHPTGGSFAGSSASSGSHSTGGFVSGGHPIPTADSGSFGTSGSFGQSGSGSFGGQAIPTKQPQGTTGSFATGGSYGQNSFGGQSIPSSQPGSTGSSGSYGSSGTFGSGSFSGQPIPSNKPVTPGSGQTSFGTAGSSSGFGGSFEQSGGSQPIPANKPGSFGQTGSTSSFGTSGSFSQTGSSSFGGQTIPTKEPTGQTSSGNFGGQAIPTPSGSGSFGGSGSYNGFQTIPTKQPQAGGQGGFTTFGNSGSGSTTFGSGYNQGNFGGLQTSKPIAGSSGSFSGSFSGSSASSASSSSTGSFTSSFQNYNPIPTALPGSPFTSETKPASLFTSNPHQFTSAPVVTGGNKPFTSVNQGQIPYTSSPQGVKTYTSGSHQTIPTTYPNAGTVSCGTNGHVCVEKFLCVNGFVNRNGKGELDFRELRTTCNTVTEICCKLDQPATPQPFFSKFAGSTPSRSVSQSVANAYTPTAKDSSLSLPSLNQFNPSGVQPGQTIQLAGSPGNSPGLIHILPNGQQSTSQPGLVHVAPTAGQKPGLVHVTPSVNDLSITEVMNELQSAPTLKNNAYLPPDNSRPPQVYTPELIPPSPPSPSKRPPTYQPQPNAPSPNYYIPPTQKPYIPPPKPTSPPNYKPYTPPRPSPSPYTPPYIPPAPPKPTYLPPTTGSPTNQNPNQYLPPPNDDIRPDAGGTDEVILIPPKPTTEYPFGGDLNTTPYPGCAAALKCVKAEFCTADGVISETVVSLTKEQHTNRVPVTSCTDPETSIIGKCCRDPKYKDPWPASQLGLYNPDSRFDNGQYKKNSNTEGRYKRPPTTKTGPARPFEPNQIGSPSNLPGVFVKPGGYPNQVPAIPFDNRRVDKPLYVDVPAVLEVNIDPRPSASNNKLSSANCGIRHRDSKPAGPGPLDADFAEIPWQAMILRDSNRSLLCGGVIIRQDAVLTAAHCVVGLDTSDVLVKGGEWKLGIDEEPKPFQIVKVAAIIVHPQYNADTQLNDVAILRLEDKFRKDKNVDTICLPSPGEDVQATFQGASCITTGWGKTILQIHLQNALMHILETTILPVGQCQSTIQQYHNSYTPLLNTNCFCGAPVVPNTDMCDVDVGSAMVCDRGDGRYTFAGIYSWDTGCGTNSQVAGFQKVDFSWAEAQLQRPIQQLKQEESKQRKHVHTGPDCECYGKK